MILGLAIVACGDDDSTSTADSTTPSVQPSTSGQSSTTDPPVPTDSEPSPTDATTPTTSSTADTSTSIAPTTSRAPTSGWTASDFVPAASVMGYSGNWAGLGGPSPAAPPPGQAPSDGYYVARLLEPWIPGADSLAIRVERLELCTVLPDGCEYMEADEMNVDPTWQLDLDVPLDGTTTVIVQGFRCWDESQQKQATGAELADLFEAYTADYATVFAPRLAPPPDGGTANWELAQQVAASPAGGFVGEQSLCPDALAGPLRYVHEDAPVLLMQTVTDGDGGTLDATELVGLDGVQFTDGVPVFYYYAGFYS